MPRQPTMPTSGLADAASGIPDILSRLNEVLLSLEESLAAAGSSRYRKLPNLFEHSQAQNAT
jgi:hypothetical protein